MLCSLLKAAFFFKVTYFRDSSAVHLVDVVRRNEQRILAKIVPPLTLNFIYLERQSPPLPSTLPPPNALGTPPFLFTQGIFNLYGSAWNQGRRTYAPVRTPSGDRNGAGDSDSAAQDGDTAGIIEGGVRPSDCHSLLREREAESGSAGNSELNGSAEPRWGKLESTALPCVRPRFLRRYRADRGEEVSQRLSVSERTCGFFLLVVSLELRVGVVSGSRVVPDGGRHGATDQFRD